MTNLINTWASAYLPCPSNAVFIHPEAYRVLQKGLLESQYIDSATWTGRKNRPLPYWLFLFYACKHIADRSMFGGYWFEYIMYAQDIIEWEVKRVGAEVYGGKNPYYLWDKEDAESIVIDDLIECGIVKNEEV